jgi:chromosome segregation ATPase
MEAGMFEIVVGCFVLLAIAAGMLFMYHVGYEEGKHTDDEGEATWEETADALEEELEALKASAKSVAEEKLRISEELDAEKKRCNKENQMAIQERANAVRLRFELEAAHKHIREFGATLKEQVQARHEVQDDLNELRATLFQLSKPKP